MYSKETSATERAKIPEEVKDILSHGKNVAVQQLTALQGIAINVKGIFLHYVYGDSAEKILEAQLGETPEAFERRHLADAEKELKRPLTSEEKQATLSRARELWVNLREMVAVGAVEPGKIGEALKELEGGTVDYSGNIGGTRAGRALKPWQSGATKSGEITSGYGPRIDPITRQPEFHGGVDIAAGEGTLLTSPISGTAIYHPNNKGYGNMLVITASNKSQRIFGHLSDVPDKFKGGVGVHVEAGEVIGYSGSTGRSTGPHLHYEVRVPGNDGKYTTIEPAQEEVTYLQRHIARNDAKSASSSKPVASFPTSVPPSSLPQSVDEAGAGATPPPSFQLPPSSQSPLAGSAAEGDHNSTSDVVKTSRSPQITVTLTENKRKLSDNNMSSGGNPKK
jgi:murein DD-endopeptidase MepM/ murein hydrolase activator NlpD